MAKVLVNIFYIIGIYLFIVFLLYIFQRSLLYLPSNEKIDVTYYSMTELKPVYLKTSDGLTLKSLFQKPKTSKNQTILVFHGNAGHIGHRVKKIKPFLTLVLDYYYLSIEVIVITQVNLQKKVYKKIVLQQ